MWPRRGNTSQTLHQELLILRVTKEKDRTVVDRPSKFGDDIGENCPSFVAMGTPSEKYLKQNGSFNEGVDLWAWVNPKFSSATLGHHNCGYDFMPFHLLMIIAYYYTRYCFGLLTLLTKMGVLFGFVSLFFLFNL